MKRSSRVASTVLIVVLAVTSVTPPAQAEGESLIERLLFNARERTARGIEALRGRASDSASGSETAVPNAGTPPASQPPAPVDPGTPPAPIAAQDPATAIAPLDSALRLRGNDDPVSQFNAGTARLANQRADAVPLLEAAAQAADRQLAAQAAYNLGNAHLGQSNFPAAIDAFKSALRHDPTTAAAKHNLELAQKLLEQQQQEQQDQDQQQSDEQQDQDQQEQDGDQDQQGDEQQDQDGDQNQDGEQDQDQQDGDQEQQEQEQQDQDQQQGDEQQDQQQGDQEQQQEQPPGEQEQQDQRERPLPQFEDLPDMTAEEAAAILESVENLEREARRQEALAAAAQAQASGKKDW